MQILHEAKPVYNVLGLNGGLNCKDTVLFLALPGIVPKFTLAFLVSDFKLFSSLELSSRKVGRQLPIFSGETVW
jgi:transposase